MRGTGVGSGVDNAVYALVPSGDGVYVGGTFDRAGSVGAVGAARWQASSGTWQSLSIGDLGGTEALALVVDDASRLWAGGMLWLPADDPKPDAFAVLQRVAWEWEMDVAHGTADARTIYYGIVGDTDDLGNWGTMIGGMGWPWSWPDSWAHAAVGAAGDPIRYDSTGEYGSQKDGSIADTIAGHEIGHTLGRGHVAGPSLPPATARGSDG